jgi:SAM-dependent methyltransferase
MPSITDLAIPGGWTERDVNVGPRTFRLLTPADPDEFLNHLVEPLDASWPHLADPYWSKVWPAAGFLAEAVLKKGTGIRGPGTGIASNPQSAIGNPQCLELGCGSGLAGLAALAAGWNVTFSDYVPQAVELALENAARNGLTGARGLVFDWRMPPREQFPFIIAADVTYDRTNVEPLLTTLAAMLAPGGEAWLGDAGRGPVADFIAAAVARGWSVGLFDEHGHPATVPALGHCQLIVLRRAESGRQ